MRTRCVIPAFRGLTIKPNFDAEADYFINALLMDDVLIKGLFKGLHKAGLKA